MTGRPQASKARHRCLAASGSLSELGDQGSWSLREAAERAEAWAWMTDEWSRGQAGKGAEELGRRSPQAAEWWEDPSFARQPSCLGRLWSPSHMTLGKFLMPSRPTSPSSVK